MSVPSSCPPTERLGQLLDDRLSSTEQSEVTAHLGGCARCQRELESLAAGEAAPATPTLHLADAMRPPEESLVRVLEGLRSGPGLASRQPSRLREDWVLSFLS